MATIHSHSEWIKRHGKSSIGQLCAELTWACLLVKLKELPKNKVTRLLSTQEKSIKIEHLTWYLQCFVCIIIPGPELQKYAKLVFHPEQLGFLVFMVMSVDELV